MADGTEFAQVDDFLGGRSGKFESHLRRRRPSLTDGSIWKSEDAGATWRSAQGNLPQGPTVGLFGLAVAASQPSTVYALTWSALYASQDGGKTWTRRGQAYGDPNARLIPGPGDGKVLYLVSSAGLVRSRDGGRSWQPVRGGLPQSERNGTNVLSLAFDRSNPKVMYAGTGGFVGGGRGVYKSTDGGEHWTPSNKGMLDRRISSLATDPWAPGTVYAVSDRGDLFKSIDGGTNWSDLSEQLKAATQYFQAFEPLLILDPTRPGVLYLAGKIGGWFYSGDGGENWQTLAMPGDGDQQEQTANAISFGEQTVLLSGVRDQSGWRFAGSQTPGQALPAPAAPVEPSATPATAPTSKATGQPSPRSKPTARAKRRRHRAPSAQPPHRRPPCPTRARLRA